MCAAPVFPDDPLYGYCHCGCGGNVTIYTRGIGKVHPKGSSARYLVGHATRRPMAERFWEKVDKVGPVMCPELGSCWIWTGARHYFGYGKISNGLLGKLRRPLDAHRVSWKLNCGEIPDGMCVLHRCDNPPCIRPDHLFLGTLRDNTQDALRKHRLPQGDRHYAAKLTAADILEIRRLHAQKKMGCWHLAKKFGVTHGAIYLIVKRKCWKHLTDFAPQMLTQETI